MHCEAFRLRAKYLPRIRIDKKQKECYNNAVIDNGIII